MGFTKAQTGAWLSRGMLAMCELDATLNDNDYIGAIASHSISISHSSNSLFPDVRRTSSSCQLLISGVADFDDLGGN